MSNANLFISVIIPAFNEENSLAKVCADLPRELITEIIVVNNGSTDRTADVARQCGCRVIDEPRKGYGQACLTGIHALNPATDIVVFIDGDYSDHGEQLPQLIQPILEKNYDFIIGSRSLGNREKGAMTPQAYYGNKLACFLMRLFWGAHYTDLGPFRAIRYDALKKIGMTDTNFGWTIEMQIKALEHHLKITEIPVDYRKRTGTSKISGTVKGTILAGEKILRTIFKYKFMTMGMLKRKLCFFGIISSFIWALITLISKSLPEYIPKIIDRLTFGLMTKSVDQLQNGFYYATPNNEMPTNIFIFLFFILFVLMLLGTRTVLHAKEQKEGPLIIIILFSVILRLIAIFGEPIHENDFYRYLWDGKSAIHGINPFKYAPADLFMYEEEITSDYYDEYRDIIIKAKFFQEDDRDRLSRLLELRDENRQLYHRIGHWQVPTIYPPVAQWTFSLSARINENSFMTLKGLFLCFDLGVIVLIILLLKHLGMNPANVIIYGWSPLVIKEYANSAHYDPIAIFFTLLAILLFISDKKRGGTISLALAFLSKFFAAVLVPFLIRPFRRFYILLFGGIIFFSYLPYFLWNGTGISGVFEGLHTYNEQWAYNASLFAILHNILGMIHPFFTTTLLPAKFTAGFLYLIFLYRLYRRPQTGPVKTVETCFLAIAGLFLINPVGDPWYFCWIMPFLCLFPRKPWILLSGLLILSYLSFHSDIPWIDIKIWDIKLLTWLIYVPFFSYLLAEPLLSRKSCPAQKENLDN